MDEPRRITSLGHTRWSDAPAAALDARLGAVLLDHITPRLALIDREQRYLYANRAMLEFLGRSAEALVGRRVSEVLGEATYAGYRPVFERAWTGETVQLEGWVTFAQRGRRYMTETFVPYGREDGEIELVAVFRRDHTELKTRELELAEGMAQLHRSEALKSAIFDHAFAALVSTDAAGHIVEFNPAAAAMFGRSRDEVLGRPVSEIVIPERFRPAHNAGMRRLQEGGEGRVLGKRLAMHALRADGSEFPMEMVLWRTAAGGEVFYTASIADVSERHDAERQIERQREALRQSEKLTAMGSLLAGVAHELNNPLAIVMGRASLLEEKCEDQPALKADAARIREAAERCGRIVRTFLDMARNRPSRRSPVSLNEMARAAAEMLLYGYQTHDIELELSLAEGLPAVQADADQIGQVVMNLLVNAQQALTGFDGARRVRVETGMQPVTGERAASVWLRVQDNGPGVDGGLRSRLFEPFFTTKAEGTGTGLGLAVSRSLARDHGGDVVLEAQAGQAGASFLLSLPLVAAEAPSAPREGAPETVPTPQARLLVVDDEADLAALMRDMLESAGYDVATAESGAIALELLDTARFDAIVSDLRMPDMDGAGLWREVSARHPELARRMLFVTGDTLSPDARQFLKASKGLSLDKPFSKADLLGRVAALLE
jgi:two-component system NtrC family sensor kinase